MKEIILVKYGEIALKGLNKSTFEDMLQKNIKRRLKKLGTFGFYRRQSTIYITPPEEADIDEVINRLQKIFGISAIQRCAVFPKDFSVIAEHAPEYLREALEGAKTFKVESKRSDKAFPMKTPEIQQELGAVILDAFPHIGVDVHEPEVTVRLEIRDNGAYLSALRIPGAGGMPVGSSGKSLLMLSGGIDSPVAGYMIAKRGVKIEAVYFHAPPYTSERAKQKVVDLAKLVAKYSGPIKLHVVNFTDIQLYIYDQCPHDELTIIMRRYMMRIAEHFAKQDNCLGLITGESIGQVASQTLQSLAATNEVCTLPVYRPVIGFDKQEIVERSWEIGTYDTSVLPYEDCCTIFVAKHPVTKPNLKVIQKSEEKLAGKIDELMEEALRTTEVLEIQ